MTHKEFLTNNNGNGQVEGGDSVLKEGGDIHEDGGGQCDGLVEGGDSLPEEGGDSGEEGGGRGDG